MKTLKALLTASQQEQLLSLLVNGPDFVSLSSSDGQVNFLNEAGRKLLGFTSLEEAKRLNTEYITSDTLIQLKDIVQILETEGVWSGELNLKHFITGEPIPVSMTTIMITDPETGRPAGRASIARDLRTEKKVREQQQKLATLVNNSKDLMSLLNMQGTNEYINAAGKKLLGLAPDADETKIPIRQFHTEEQLKFVESEILPTVMREGRWSGRFSAKNAESGEIIPLENNCIRIDDPRTGEAVAIGAVMRDLRPELEAQRVIEESANRFRSSIMQAPIAISLLEGPDFHITTANDLMLQIWGKPASIIGLPLIEALPEIKDQGFIELLQDVRNTRIAFRGSETLARLTRSGVIENAYFNFVYAPIDEQGQDTIIVIASEVTDQVLAKKEIEESETRFRELILQAPMATALYRGPELIIDVANEAMIRLWGKSHDVIGKPLAEALPELEGQPFIPRLQEIFQTGIPFHSDQERAELFVDGKLQSFWFNYTYKPLLNAKGEVHAILNMAVDISKQVLLQQQKDQFIGIASHELKTPVTSIKGYTQVMEAMFRQKGFEKEATMLTRMSVQINKLTSLIDDLLDVTKIQAGKLQIHQRPFDIEQLVEEVVSDFQLSATTHSVTIAKDVAGNAFADPERIAQVLTNFLANAVKYSPRQTTVEVRITRNENHYRVSVIDVGMGIPIEKQRFIFDQFYRVNEDAHTGIPGMGLGLYISAEIMRREKGNIGVNSEPGKGSEFWFEVKKAE